MVTMHGRTQKNSAQASACFSYILKSYQYGGLSKDSEALLADCGDWLTMLARMGRTRGLDVTVKKVGSIRMVTEGDQLAVVRLVGDHFVVLKGVQGGRCEVYDPGFGHLSLGFEQMDALLSGEVLILKTPKRLKSLGKTKLRQPRWFRVFRMGMA